MGPKRGLLRIAWADPHGTAYKQYNKYRSYCGGIEPAPFVLLAEYIYAKTQHIMPYKEHALEPINAV